MPQLNQLTCKIELGRTNKRLKEYGISYGDGRVDCYIATPKEDLNFSIHLTSNGYIAQGLAMFVYMDGQYQCNRNKCSLVLPDEDTMPAQTNIDFRVRQKEEIIDGQFVGRDWSFAPLHVGRRAGCVHEVAANDMVKPTETRSTRQIQTFSPMSALSMYLFYAARQLRGSLEVHLRPIPETWSYSMWRGQYSSKKEYLQKVSCP